MASRGVRPTPHRIIGRARAGLVLAALLTVAVAALPLIPAQTPVTREPVTAVTPVALTEQAAGQASGGGAPGGGAPSGGVPSQPDPESPPALRPVQIVVLVDESGSLSQEDIARERDAARLIAQGELSPDSTISVVGFASSDGPGQSPTDPVCPPTRLNSTENRQFLAECIGKLNERTQEQGNGTDHVAALRQALGYLDDSGADQPKIVFLLTDGVLDVSNSPAYGANLSADDRTEAARQQVPGVLDELNRAGVQVWPLGFGNVDRAQLESFASGAAQQSCGVQTPTPRATVIGGSADLLGAIRDAYATANCIPPAPVVPGPLPSGGTAELSVDISAIATDGAILVFKRDPRVTVSYRDPQGTTVPKRGSLGISRFDVSGENTEVESLRIIDPMPGSWTVRLTSAPSVPTQDVAATVIFQGAIRAVLSVSPPTPTAGEVTEVSMQVRARRAPITDPELLRELAFVVTLSGSSNFPPVRVDLADSDQDGLYSGQLTVPASATGTLAFAGTVTGIGVSGDERIFNTRVADPSSDTLRGQLRLVLDDSEVVPGEAVAGKAVITNNSGQPRRLRLLIADPAPGTLVTPRPAVLDLPASGSSELDFTLVFAANTALGPNQATLQLVDDADTATVVSQQPFATNVAEVPSVGERLLWLWLLLGAAVIAAVAFLITRFREQRRARSARDLRVELYRGPDLLSGLDAPESTGEVFRFVIRDDQFLGPRLESPQLADDITFQLRRSARGRLQFVQPSGEGSELAMSERRPIGNGLDIVVLHKHDKHTAGPVATPEPISPAPNSNMPTWY